MIIPCWTKKFRLNCKLGIYNSLKSASDSHKGRLNEIYWVFMRGTNSPARTFSLSHWFVTTTGFLGLIVLALMYVFMAFSHRNFRKGLKEKGEPLQCFCLYCDVLLQFLSIICIARELSLNPGSRAIRQTFSLPNPKHPVFELWC